MRIDLRPDQFQTMGEEPLFPHFLAQTDLALALAHVDRKGVDCLRGEHLKWAVHEVGMLLCLNVNLCRAICEEC